MNKRLKLLLPLLSKLMFAGAVIASLATFVVVGILVVSLILGMTESYLPGPVGIMLLIFANVACWSAYFVTKRKNRDISD